MASYNKLYCNSLFYFLLWDKTSPSSSGWPWTCNPSSSASPESKIWGPDHQVRWQSYFKCTFLCGHFVSELANKGILPHKGGWGCKDLWCAWCMIQESYSVQTPVAWLLLGGRSPFGFTCRFFPDFWALHSKTQQRERLAMSGKVYGSLLVWLTKRGRGRNHGEPILNT